MGRFLYLCRILILVCSYESEEYSTQGIARFWHGMKLSVINTASKGVKTRLNGFSRFRKYLKQWSEILQSVQRGGKFHVLLRGRHKVYPKRVFVAGLVLFNSSRRGYKSVRKPFSIIQCEFEWTLLCRETDSKVPTKGSAFFGREQSKLQNKKGLLSLCLCALHPDWTKMGFLKTLSWSQPRKYNSTTRTHSHIPKHSSNYT